MSLPQRVTNGRITVAPTIPRVETYLSLELSMQAAIFSAWGLTPSHPPAHPPEGKFPGAVTDATALFQLCFKTSFKPEYSEWELRIALSYQPRVKE